MRDDSDDELGTEDHKWEWIRSGQDPTITGARFGRFTCSLGDCLLLKADNAKEAWVAIVCEFKDDSDGTKLANFMWFSTPREIRNRRRKRHDALDVCIDPYVFLKYSHLTVSDGIRMNYTSPPRLIGIL